MLPASGSRHSLAIAIETVYGTTDANPTFNAVRMKSTNIEFKRASMQSAEIRSDRQVAGFRLGTKSVTGDVVTEATYGNAGAFDQLLAGALQGAWAVNVLKSGSTRQSFTVERHFADTGKYLRYRGCEVSKLGISFKAASLVDCTFSLMGIDADASAAAAIAGAVYTAATTSEPMTAIEGTVKIGGAASGVISGIDLSLDNGLAANPVVGSAIGLQPSDGKSNCTGTATLFFVDTAQYDNFCNETETSLEFTLADNAGNSYDVLLSNVKWTAAQVPVQNEGSITVTLPFQALPDANGVNIQITRAP